MEENYLKILEDSLLRKLEILEEIQVYNARQQELFLGDKADLAKFDEYIDEKDGLIERLAGLDEGFERLYAKVSEALKNDKAKYAAQIGRMQTLVRRITEKSVTIQAEEARNKALIEEYFKKERLKIRSDRKGSKAAYDYYQSMSRTVAMPPSFLDSKQ